MSLISLSVLLAFLFTCTEPVSWLSRRKDGVEEQSKEVAFSQTHCAHFDRLAEKLCVSSTKKDIHLLAVLMANCHREKMGMDQMPIQSLEKMRKTKKFDDTIALLLLGRLPNFCSTIQLMDMRLGLLTKRQFELLQESVREIRQLTKDRDKTEEIIEQLRIMETHHNETISNTKDMNDILESLEKSIVEMPQIVDRVNIGIDNMTKLSAHVDAETNRTLRLTEQYLSETRELEEKRVRNEANKKGMDLNSMVFIVMLFVVNQLEGVCRLIGIFALVGTLLGNYGYRLAGFGGFMKAMRLFSTLSSVIIQGKGGFLETLVRDILGIDQPYILVAASIFFCLLPMGVWAVAYHRGPIDRNFNYSQPSSGSLRRLDIYNTSEVVEFFKSLKDRVRRVEFEMLCISKNLDIAVDMGPERRTAAFSHFAETKTPAAARRGQFSSKSRRSEYRPSRTSVSRPSVRSRRVNEEKVDTWRSKSRDVSSTSAAHIYDDDEESVFDEADISADEDVISGSSEEPEADLDGDSDASEEEDSQNSGSSRSSQKSNASDVAEMEQVCLDTPEDDKVSRQLKKKEENENQTTAESSKKSIGASTPKSKYNLRKSPSAYRRT